MSITKLKDALLLRERPMSQLENTVTFAQSVQSADSIRLSQLSRRFAHLPRIIEVFNEYHNVVLLSTTDPVKRENEFLIGKHFDDMVYELEGLHATLFPPPEAKVLVQSLPPASHTNVNVRLPKLELPRFEGELKGWRPFIDMFDATIHNNSTLSAIEKFNYLLSALKGPPLALVQSTPLSEANYLIAYNSLVQRFNNTRSIATSHWIALENYASITNADSTNLRLLLDTFTENLSALKFLNFPVVEWDFILLNMLLKRLDRPTVSEFEMTHGIDKIPSFESLVEFVNKRCKALENSKLQTLITDQVKPTKGKMSVRKPFAIQTQSSKINYQALVASSPNLCPVCKQAHSIAHCPAFIAKAPYERYELAKSITLCFNCLNSGHTLTNCPSEYSCKSCRRKHHTMLHFKMPNRSNLFSQAPSAPLAPANNSQPEGLSKPQTDGSVTSLISSCSDISPALRKQVLLATVIIEIADKWGQFHRLRALIDSGSQASFIVSSRANQFGFPRSRSEVPVCGLGNNSTAASSIVSSVIRPAGVVDTLPINLIVLQNICSSLPTTAIDASKYLFLRNLQLGDPNWFKPSPIDVLLGADVYGCIVQPGMLKGDADQPVAINTIFGWVIVGPTHDVSQPVSSFFSSVDTSINSTLRSFWELEEVPTVTPLSPEDQKAEALFQTSVYRDSSGRFGVSLPFSSGSPVFTQSQDIADRRLFALERRLARQPDVSKLYMEFMKDYLDSGNMSFLSVPAGTYSYFVPHHCIFKQEGGKAKIRVVFDASAKDANGVSLNDTLLTGPKLQNDIVLILLRFRSKAVVFTADVRQMYRQILIHPNHRNFQLIRFRFHPNDPVSTFALNTVTYGVSSAPFLAIRVLLELANIHQNSFPLASKAIHENLYVDDFACTCSTIEEAVELKRQLVEILSSSQFELRKWTSNYLRVLDDVPIDHLQTQFSSFGEDDLGTRILGLQWVASSDVFTFHVEISQSACTKRNMLSQVARIYDPLGFLGPLLFFVKHLIQRLWTLGLDWDQTPPLSICDEWRSFVSQLNVINSLKIPRFLVHEDSKRLELHAFCDASQNGYAAVLYIRSIVNDSPMVRFLISRSKVAPLKTLSIPRLELCAAVLLSKLVSYALQALSGYLSFDRIFAWTDSTVALSWIRSSPHKWKTFVANRVTYIQERVPPLCWHHVGSVDNAADPGSRGLFPEDLMSCSLWWAGPDFLYLPIEEWLSLTPLEHSDSSVEAKTILVAVALELDLVNDLLTRFSSVRTIQRIISYILRFVSNCRSDSKLIGPISEDEAQAALMLIIKVVQSSVFAAEILKLKTKQMLPKSLRRLSPFLDAKGVLRVGGRLTHSNLPLQTKHPALLPSKHRLTELIVFEVHRRNFHPGLNTTIYLLQQQFWVLSSRRAIRHYLSHCIPCFRQKPIAFSPPMGNLPSIRISQVKPFSAVGIDFGGPFLVKSGLSKRSPTVKSYLCLFVCLATKAVHLELVSNLSSEAFIATFRRFIARRGRCSNIFSDNGTNFIGANRELWKLAQLTAEKKSIAWKFIPPNAPHFGGIWEIGIKSAKTHLARVVGSQILTFEELTTLFAQIEALMNSRPLCPLSSDPNDFAVLTPGHFLTLEPLTAPPDPDLTHLNTNRLSRWQLIQRFQQMFWSRWQNEYLHDLQQRSKWNRCTKNSIELNTMVLIKEDHTLPLKWKLGRVVAVFPGTDGIVRVTQVRTSQGLLKRPTHKLCPLPLA